MGFYKSYCIDALLQAFRVIKDHGLTSKYSVEDLIEYLKSITKIRINGGEWITAEVSSKTTKLLKACDIHIT